jgi:microcin C transport system substrate-binding protein
MTIGLVSFCRTIALPAFAAAIAFAALIGTATAAPQHGLSPFGELKYAADFKAFDYVNPDAPKGGKVSQIGSGGRTTFDSFNAYILKGDAAQGLELVFDSLMTRALDEPDAVYGLVAESADVADDKMSVTFALRRDAKFADGSLVTADDCVYSFDILKEKGDPSYRLSLRDVVKAEAADASHVRYTFQGKLVRDLPLMVAQLPILSKAYYAKQPFDETTLDYPLGSGPYKIKAHKAGTFVTYERRADYWAKDLPVNRGRFNFDEVRYDYFRDRTLELESLFSGGFDFREEFTSKDWANGYNNPTVTSGKILRQTLADELPSGAQGFFINTRREKFSDVRVRKALGLAFDFEWSNRNLFFGLYTRTQSYFDNSDMKAAGPPSAAELALLEPYRAALPAAVFGEPELPPATDGSGNNRDHLREAGKLLAEAGWTLKQEIKVDPNCGSFCGLMRSIGLQSKPVQNVLRNAKGEQLTVEFLTYESGFERIIGPYIKNLAQIGVEATIRRVDPAQYEQRTETFDFDFVIQRYSLRLTPGVELKNYWGTDAAKIDGSLNLAGIKDPVVDALAEKVMAAKSRDEVVAATRAVDRVLRAGHYWVPHWYKAAHNLAFWDKFSWPAIKPKYDRGALTTWWYDAGKAAKLAAKP